MSEIITKTECHSMLTWIYENEDRFKFNPAGPNRKYYVFGNCKCIPKLFFEVKDRIILRERIADWCEVPTLPDCISWISNGGFLHHHRDRVDMKGFKHIRYNLFLSIPINGGDPIYNGKIMSFRERYYIKCNSGDEKHSCKPVIGEKPRIAVSYGFLTPDPIHTKL